ncbi:MraY family glycosyltransferase [Rothia sp. P13129]|uniref:MraY family glycosyltransferase n=1 Tax=unclassified Rothia (in: high G+C Gram-positive bacteria) TaxID=2689056 RepID=UPI003AC423CD
MENIMMWVPAFVAFMVSLFLPRAIIPLLKKWNMVDIPTERSSHHRQTLRGMGIAAAAGTCIAYILAIVFGMISIDRSVALSVLVGMLGSVILGWLEDYRGVPILWRFGIQLAIGVVVTSLLTYSLHTSWVWVPLAVLAIAAYINVANFMDGLNGISGLHGFIVGGFYAYAGWVNDLNWLFIGGSALSLAYLAFLPWNLRSVNNVFLGDSGSYFLGGSIASMAVGAFLSGVYLEYLLSPVLVYLADTGVTLWLRIYRKEKWYCPHRQHAYQRLTDVGLSHIQSALVVSLLTIFISVLAIVTLPYETQEAIWAGLLTFVLLGMYLYSPQLVKKFKKDSLEKSQGQGSVDGQ